MLHLSPLTERLIDIALAEDLGTGGDVTTDAIFSGTEHSRARLIAKAPLVLAGGAVFRYVLRRVSALPGAPEAASSVIFEVPDGAAVEPGTTLATLEGPTTTLLKAERLGLNLLQRMSGIATKTRSFADALKGGQPVITDTRKTLPGLRELDKYAVRAGGGHNHRYNLGAGVLIKENHIAAAGSIARAVEQARAHAPHLLKIEVEVRDLQELSAALAAGADVVMLDNFDTPTIQTAIETVAGRALIEVSGNITLERLPELRPLAIDVISSGALTHSVSAADISMLFEGT